jgi:type IV secretory pathway VirB3-like protein
VTSKRSSALAAILLALPIVSITAFVWVYVESGDKGKVADISQNTFWYVIPTLPMFLVLSWLLRNDYNFYLSLFVWQHERENIMLKFLRDIFTPLKFISA